jgi:hypothetical protein
MTDQELDRALASALDVEHGPDFPARVRIRVAKEPAPSPRLPWLPAAAVAAAVLIMALSFRPGVEEEPAAGRQASAAAEPTDVSSAGRIEPRTETAPVAVATPARLVSRPKSTVDSLPAPQISREDASSVRLLVASAQQGIAAELLSPSGGSDRPIEVAALEVPLLGAERPIEINAVDAGERQ